MSNEIEYKEIIRKNLSNTINSGFIPEIGQHKSGKVRDVHFTRKEIGSPIVMVSSDRVSCFDYILSRRIPFKGKVLNLFTEWAFKNTEDIVQNALIKSPHDNVLIQKKMNKINFEFVVRGFVWGSMAEEYEAGSREFCGFNLPNDLLRYQKLPEPILTPATKAEDGDHDINISFDHIIEKLGSEQATKLKEISLNLYKRASELAEKKGFLFIDTKYEFGLDNNNEIYLIDEANTPDSSRYCRISEYDKFTKIKNLMIENPNYKIVTELLKDNSELKIEELSKQFVRDVLVEGGFSGYGGSGAIPDLTNEQIIETSWRYISLYEEVTGNKFTFNNSGNIKSDLISSLVKENFIKGGIVIIMAGSDSDIPHINKIKEELEKFGIKSKTRICSAHKQPGAGEEIIKKYNDSLEPVVIVAIAGGTDALSGVASFHSVHPVISCPPNPDEFTSCIRNPPGSSNSLILNPSNLARHIAQIFSHSIIGIKEQITENNNNKIKKLVIADEKINSTSLDYA